MHFEEGKPYHIYNIGNQKQPIFYHRENYFFFIEKIRKYILSVADIINWCLMPNHFHFLIIANKKSTSIVKRTNIELFQLSENIRLMLSQYMHAINKQEGLEGSLFRQNTKAKCLSETNSENYVKTCFYYIHQNPLKAGLVTKLEDWEFSSIRDYAKIRKGTICNYKLAKEVINYDEDNFLEQSYSQLNDDELKNIW